jgi:hypothetical protein
MNDVITFGYHLYEGDSHILFASMLFCDSVILIND